MKIFIVAMMLVMVGCSTIETLKDRGIEYVHSYCKRTDAEREAVRAMVNEAINPHSLELHCAENAE